MRTHAGLWIDHRKAVVVTISDRGETTRQVDSDVEGHVRYSGGSGTSGSREGTGEDTRERHFEGQLARYFDEVVDCVRDAEGIVIFGPGEARSQLKTHLERAGLGARVVAVEAADKMTDRQIVARVRQLFVR